MTPAPLRQVVLSLLSALAVVAIAGAAVVTTALAAPADPGPPTARPASTDTDGDSLPDDWELNGYDADGDGSVDVDLPAMGARYDKKDLFVETDYMAGRLASTTAFDRIVQVFAAAPVTNPDGSTGIRIHLDAGPAGGSSYDLGGGNEIPYDDELTTDELRAAKATHQTPARAAVFSYILFADSFVGCSYSGLAVALDLAVILVGPKCGWTPNDNIHVGTFVHELGHLLGLSHGGGEDTNRKPNHLSVMNYFFSFQGVPRPSGDAYFGYSGSALPPLVETSLVEPSGLGTPSASEFRTRWYCPDGTVRLSGPAGQPIDWNCDGDSTDTTQVDLNRDGQLTRLDGHADWYAVSFGGGAVGDPVGARASSVTTFVGERFPG
jgi:hypothetical protein